MNILITIAQGFLAVCAVGVGFGVAVMLYFYLGGHDQRRIHETTIGLAVV